MAAEARADLAAVFRELVARDAARGAAGDAGRSAAHSDALPAHLRPVGAGGGSVAADALMAGRRPLRLFAQRHDEYYTAHGEDAEWIAETYFNTRDVLKAWSGAEEEGRREDEAAAASSAPLWTVNLRPQKVVTILRDALLRRHLRVELWRREGGEWRLSKEGSPGNLQAFDELLLDRSLATSPVVMAVKEGSNGGGQRVLGVAFADATERLLEVCEFVDDDKFSNLRSAVVQRGVAECLLGRASGRSEAEQRRLVAVLEECKVVVTQEHRATTGAFSPADSEQELRRLAGAVQQQQFALLEQRNALQALSWLVRYLDLLRDESSHGRFRLRGFDLAQFVRLDAAAVEALNLFPQASDSNKNMSLFGLLNKCCTASGGRLLAQWLRQPLVSVEALTRRHNLVEALVEDAQLRQSLRDEHLKRAADLDRFCKRVQRGQAGLEDVVGAYLFLTRLPALAQALRGYEGRHAALLHGDFTQRVEQAMRDVAQLEAMVEQTVDQAAIKRHEYLINPQFDPKLKRLSEEKKAVLAELEEARGEVARDVELDEAKVKLNRQGAHGYHLRISRKDEKAIRGRADYTSLETRKDGVRFTSMRVRQLSRRFEAAAAEYERLQESIVAKCLEVVATYTPVLEALDALLAELDVLLSFAHVAANAPTPYVRPALLPMGAGVLELRACRHPCLEMQDHVSFIPNDVNMRAGESNVQVITGPNMGGKSTFIRQTGVAVLMAQIGSFVPCESATVSVVDCILARVGAGDSQLRGVSTFMKEMVEAAAILRSASRNSLLIIDELGRGTSTYDGFGLAWAIAEHIATQIGAFALFATHFHELTALASEAKG